MAKILAANLKSNLTFPQIESYFNTLDAALENPGKKENIFVFPPSFALSLGARFFTLGAQNAYGAKSGAYTGEITQEGLESHQIKTNMLGHSERRGLGESQDFIAQKFRFYKQAGFKIIYCIGESLQVRQSGQRAIEEFLDSELLGIDLDYTHLIVAYEPIWAIGTGISAKIEDIEPIFSFLRAKMQADLLYGGSVNENNLAEILAIKNASGVLIGSAALRVESFLKMIHFTFKENACCYQKS